VVSVKKLLWAWLGLALLFYRVEAVCVGNTLGQCTDENPQNCVITRAAVGSNLDAGPSDDVDRGRTSFNRFPVEFTHDGATSSFTVSIIAPSPTDSGSSVTESSCDGQLTVFFTNPAEKVVRIRVAQVNLGGRTATSQNALRVVYDNVPPIILPLQVFQGTTTDGNPEPYSAGTTYFTSDDLVITARVTDPPPSAAPENLGIQVADGLSQVGAVVPSNNPGSGLFELNLGLINEVKDGEFQIEVVALDSTSSTFPDGSPANRSEPVRYRVVLDREAPVLTGLEAIIHSNTQNQSILEIPGAFVKSGTVRIRASFSEPLKQPPTLTVTQGGSGVGEPPPPYKIFFDSVLFQASPDTVEYILTPQATVSDLGPIALSFGEDGRDFAGNPLALDAGVLSRGETLQRALILDGVAPDLRRVDLAVPGQIQSDPKNGDSLPEGRFPEQILVIVKDYNLPDSLGDGSGGDLTARNNASGVDFARVLGTGSDGEAGIRVELSNPEGSPLLGTLATKPPNGLVYILPRESQLFQSSGGVAPEGIYTVKISLVDRVGNAGTETFFFEMDNTDISADRLQVSILPQPANGENFSPDTGNPLLKNPISGQKIPDNPGFVDLGTLDAVRDLQSVKICSTDPSFDLTRSPITVNARLSGPDTIPRTLLVTGTPNLGDIENTCGLSGSLSLSVSRDQLSAFPSLNFPFPNPNSVGSGIGSGERDPRFGLFDGPYRVEILARDAAGNESDPIVKEFLLDTTPPFTRETFPKNFSKTNSPLRHVSAILTDPHPPRKLVFDEEGHVNFGSGISVDFSSMDLHLQVPYRPQSIDLEVFDPVQDHRVKGRLTFTHKPNSLDPSLPSFHPKDDAYRILLEFVTSLGQAMTLPTDGGADGIYRIDVVPVDNAGNTVEAARAGQSGFNPAQNPDRDGPKEVRKSFFFLLDTVAPHISLDDVSGQPVRGSLSVAGSSFTVLGKTRDLSARLDQPTHGGAGVDRVDYELVFFKDGKQAPAVPGSDGSLPKPNPVISGTAWLSPIQLESSDPHTSESRPLDPTTYRELPLEERSFRIDGRLPSLSQLIRSVDVPGGGEGQYFLRILSHDLAGNIGLESVEIFLSLSDLQPPELKSPDFGARIDSTAIELSWKPVSKAFNYILSLSSPQGGLSTFSISGVETSGLVKTLQILNQQGEYRWWVAARDSVGNTGNRSLEQTFTLDTHPPVLRFVTWSDFSPEAQVQINRGVFKLHLLFDEPLSQAPRVSFQPFLSSFARQDFTTSRFQGAIWEGQGQVPPGADSSWNGPAILWVENARDLAGTSMLTDKSRSFEIKTGPTYALRFFENPVFKTEIVVLIQASERLGGTPLLFNPVGVDFLNEELVQVGDQTYSTVFKLQPSNEPVGQVEITGRDLLGNASTRSVTFPIRSIDGALGGEVRSSRMQLSIEPGAFQGIQTLAMLPPPEFASSPSQVETKSLKSKNRIVEWVEVGEVGLLYPSGQQFALPARLTIKPREPLADHQGYFLEVGGQMKFLASADLPGSQAGAYSGQVNQLGRVVVLEDHNPPRIELAPEMQVGVLDPRAAKLRFSIHEAGSGLVSAGPQVVLGGRRLESQALGEGQYEASYGGILSPGSHWVSIRARDRLGNASVLRSEFKVESPIRIRLDVFPNPARSFSRLRYRLSRGASFLALKILDTHGRVVFKTDSQVDFSLELDSGQNTYEWDLANGEGEAVANGVYFCKLLVKDAQGAVDRAQSKIAVLR
jgi:hypothetical protein